MREQRHTPTLFILTIVSILLVGIVSNVNAKDIYQEYAREGFSQPAAAILMQGISHHVYPWDRGSQKASGLTRLAATASANIPALYPAALCPDSPKGSHTEGNSGGAPDGGSSGMHITADETGTGTDSAGAPAPGSSQDPQSASGSGGSGQPSPDPGTGASDAQNPDSLPQEPVQYDFTEVTQDYFDDALVIGDSRAVGIQLYSGWDNMTYYAESGMTVYNMFTRGITLADGTETTIDEALQENTFGKIYLEIGINEMGTGTVDSFMEAYEKAVQRLRQLQPEADIFLCGIMYVRQSKSESDPIFNNPGIRERNERIAALADRNSIFYLDINEVTSDETGNLNPEYTWDEVHLLGRYNVLWTEYLSKHGILKTPKDQNIPL